MLADSVRPVKVCHNDGDGKGDAEHAADSAQGRHQLASRRPGGNITVPCTYVRVIHSCACLRERKKDSTCDVKSLPAAIRGAISPYPAHALGLFMSACVFEKERERKIAHVTPGGDILAPCTYTLGVYIHVCCVCVCVCMSGCLGEIERAKERKIAHNDTTSLPATVRGCDITVFCTYMLGLFIYGYCVCEKLEREREIILPVLVMVMIAQ